MIDILLEIVSLKRPHRGANERYVAEGILSRLPGEMRVFNDAAGEPMAYVYVTDPASTSLFVGHLDTVHQEDGHNPVIFDEELEWMSKADGLPLGADDGAGVWLLYMMALAGVPGTYLFPLGEERGGVGSDWMSGNVPKFLCQFKRAIAFDRKGTHSVITHQWAGRCCSDEFADALAAQLTTTIPGGYVFQPDNTGVFTDTANFIDEIPECTNISAGYSNEHTGKETLDVGYLKALLVACLKIDWEALPTARDPTFVDLWKHADDWGWEGRVSNDSGCAGIDLRTMTDEEVCEFVYDCPEEAAELLISMRNEGGMP